jgi:hypothetical protein
VLFAPAVRVTAQDSNNESLRQYLFPAFTKGIVIMKSGLLTVSSLNYNMVTEKMIYKNDTTLMEWINTKPIDTVIILNRRFVPVDEAFYEVVVNAPITLFIQHRSRLIPPGKPAGYGGTSQTSSSESISFLNTKSGVYNLMIPSEYEIKPAFVYWIRKDNTMLNFLNNRQFVKLFPKKKSEIESYIKENHLNVSNRDDLIKIVYYCNEISM